MNHYESRGVPEKEAERRPWATVNKESGGGKQIGSGRGRPESHASSQKGGRCGGQASARRPAARAFSCGEEGCGGPQAQCFVMNARLHDWVHSPNRSARTTLISHRD